jgi:hypothetical protein
MQPNKTKIALVIAAMYLGVNNASYAATKSFVITAETLADVELLETTELDFGTNIFTTAGICNMDADAPSSDLLLMNAANSIAESDYGALTGGGCINGTAIPGVYKISGAVGADVNITLSGITETEYTFEPDGAVADFSKSTADDTIGALAFSGVNTFSTAGADDDTNPGLAATLATPGDLIFTLGGTLTVLTTLTASTEYTNTFSVNVVY